VCLQGAGTQCLGPGLHLLGARNLSALVLFSPVLPSARLSVSISKIDLVLELSSSMSTASSDDVLACLANEISQCKLFSVRKSVNEGVITHGPQGMPLNCMKPGNSTTLSIMGLQFDCYICRRD
jgi:hypothetical protein